MSPVDGARVAPPDLAPALHPVPGPVPAVDQVPCWPHHRAPPTPPPLPVKLAPVQTSVTLAELTRPEQLTSVTSLDIF